jgi:hypothetical protein
MSKMLPFQSNTQYDCAESPKEECIHSCSVLIWLFFAAVFAHQSWGGGLGPICLFFSATLFAPFLWFEPRSLAVVSLSHESTVHGVFFQWTFVWSQKEESSTFQGVMPG